MNYKQLIFAGIILVTGMNVVVTSAQARDFMIHAQGTISEPVKKIFDVMGFPGLTTLEQANQCAQQNLLRQGERWDAQQHTSLRDRITAHKDELIEQLRLVGMIDAIVPKGRIFQYALLMGGLHERMKLRIHDLEKLVHDGYVFSTLVLLGSERPLEQFEKQGLPEDVTTESAMMRYELNQTALKDFPRVIYISSPMKKVNTKVVRPTTDDTFNDFLKMDPIPGHCLVISNNPYIKRQQEVARALLPAGFTVEGFGRAARMETFDIHMALDEFARMLYQELQVYRAL